jgi:hypothetical protein
MMPAVLAAWDVRVRREMSRFDHLIADTAARGSVLRAPASEAEISTAERRLGVRFPESYRAFLALSNGADASTIGVVTEENLPNWPHGFVAAAEIHPVREVLPDLIETWTDGEEFTDANLDRTPASGTALDVKCFSRIADALLIAGWKDANHDVIVPGLGDNEWEFWSVQWGGAVAYRSFGDFLIHELNRPDDRPRPELANVYAAGVAAGQTALLTPLSEIGDPRARELARAIVTDETAEEHVKRGAVFTLQQIADPRDIQLLHEAFRTAIDWRYAGSLSWALGTAFGDWSLVPVLAKSQAHAQATSSRHVEE